MIGESDESGAASSGAGALRDALSRCRDLRSAADAVVEHVTCLGYEMPSVYLARGGRLRCMAARGYSHIRDGVRPWAGVLGTCFASGEVQHLRKASDDPLFLQTVPGIEQEVAVPIRLGQEVVGVLNVEAKAALPDEFVALAAGWADLLAARIAELGGIPPESDEQLLVRHALRLAALDDVRAIVEELAVAACDVVGMPSSLVLTGLDGSAPTCHGRGPLGPALEALPAGALSEISGWVRSGASVYSIDHQGDAFAGNEVLHDIGVRAIVVVPLIASEEWLGDLLLADTSSAQPHTDDVERLELLAAQAATSIRTAHLLSDLRVQASTDPLTRLGHHASFTEAVEAAHRSLAPGMGAAVLVIDVDNFKLVNDEHGHPHGDQVLLEVVDDLAGALRDEDRLYRVGGDEFAAVLLVDDGGAEATAVAHRLRAAVEAGGHGTVSIGLAVGARGQGSKVTVQRADRALYEAKRLGRNAVVAAPPA